jgi:hypothetical protein
MQRTEMVALVAGTTVGIGGGALGAFLLCTAGRVVVHRVLDQFDDQYLDLRQPAPLMAGHGAHQGSRTGSALSQWASDRPSRTLHIV